MMMELLRTFVPKRRPRTTGPHKVIRFEQLEQRLTLSTSQGLELNLLSQPSTLYSQNTVVQGNHTEVDLARGWISLGNSATSAGRQFSLADILGSEFLQFGEMLHSGAILDDHGGSSDTVITSNSGIVYYSDISTSGQAFDHDSGDQLSIRALSDSDLGFTLSNGLPRTDDSGGSQRYNLKAISIPSPTPGSTDLPNDGGGFILLNDVFRPHNSEQQIAQSVSSRSWLLEQAQTGAFNEDLVGTRLPSAAQGRDMAFELAAFSARQAPIREISETGLNDSVQIAEDSHDSPLGDAVPVKGSPGTSDSTNEQPLETPPPKHDLHLKQDSEIPVPEVTLPEDQLGAAPLRRSDTPPDHEANPADDSQAADFRQVGRQTLTVLVSYDRVFDQWGDTVANSLGPTPLDHVLVRENSSRYLMAGAVGLAAFGAFVRPSSREHPCDSRRTILPGPAQKQE